MTFTEAVFKSPIVQEILQNTIDHPFNRELGSGQLEKSKFQFYLKQDSLYLLDFSRALAITAGRLSQPDHVRAFLRFSEGALVAERSLHQHYFELYGIQVDAAQSPSCFAYTNFLLATSLQKAASVSCAALLPCFWVYREVGKAIFSRSATNNHFQKWIDTYAGDEFDQVVTKASKITNEIAENAGAEAREQMNEAFILSCRLEWMFWDSAYRLEDWKP